MNRSYLEAADIQVFYNKQELIDHVENSDPLEFVYDDRNISEENNDESVNLDDSEVWEVLDGE